GLDKRRSAGAGIGADQFPDAPLFDQPGDAHFGIGAVIGDDGKIADTRIDQAVHEVERVADLSEAADQHHGAVLYAGKRFRHAVADFVDHCRAPCRSNGRNTGKFCFPVWSRRYVTSTSWPIASSSGEASTMLVIIVGPSSSVTMAKT